jgi:hypothetical protein
MPENDKPGPRKEAAPDSGVLSRESYAQSGAEVLARPVRALRGVGLDGREVLEVEVGQTDQQ